MSYVDYIKRAHSHMDAALVDGNRVYARLAMSAAQSARHRATSSVERAECADLIREAERILK